MDSERYFRDQLSQEYGERKEAELSPELEQVAKNVLDCYDFDPAKESFLVLTDTKVMADNPDFLIAIERELKARTSESPRAKGNYEILTVPASEYSATAFGEYIAPKMKNRPVLIATSMSRSHSPETAAARNWAPSDRMVDLADDLDYQEQLENLAKTKGSRLISMTKAHNPFEILTKGAVEESVEVLREKADKVNELLEGVEDVHITTANGTDLKIKIRYDKSDVEDGRINQLGKVANYPIGEWSCSITLEGSSGTLVVDVAAGGNHNKDMFDQHGPIKVDIEDGVVTDMNDLNLDEFKQLLEDETDYDLLEKRGSSSAEHRAERKRIQELADKYFDDKKIDNPLMRSMLKYWIAGDTRDHHCFRLAEFAVGTNTKACEGKEPKDIGSSEGEKIYGTLHIAVGNNGVFGVDKNDTNYNDCQIHCDMVVSSGTIECTKKDEKSKFNLLENGKPIGY